VIGRGTVRTRLAKVYWFRTVSLVSDLLGEDDQRTILGASTGELLSGGGVPSRRSNGFAVEFGRWVAFLGLDGEIDGDEIRDHLVEVAKQIRDHGVTFSQAAAHYRKNRLGSRAGTATALSRHLAHALDGYLRRFPATTREDIADAIRRLEKASSEVST
jgi:hypothetical protein